MRKKIVAGNWKMNGSMELLNTLVPALAEEAKQSQAEILVCPPALYLGDVQRKAGDHLLVGAQNCHEAQSGAFTGEIAAGMLAEMQLSHVLVGHSERRAIYGETDQLIAAKTQAAIASGLVAVLCVGETLDERESGRTLDVVLGQVNAVVSQLGLADWSRLVIAYEPVWAIGTGKTATADQAQDVHKAIRNALADYGQDYADAMRILYGGSVKAANAEELFTCPDIDGGLVGGASLNADEFISICRAAN
ncbi:triose-phosphate isomerase [Oceanospirillum linum]|uniref:Triosephosphate isomerase n=1 Tax=Oceanospirillum linum TaxID=966 RepID=A0A1T1H8X5_OCELI|nr:triose-phosphate isomerase [Oceanospirillum linum]OOV86226.1 triose-phosphate isomerase [Oceanospirillum linum]SEG37867.1 triosephosphate isomerase [Oleiphilus messinensis]SMP32236.1 triosephosphate isomerase [Oceanospirillum linum]